jgi:sugar phosphate isomerase/epimerase
MTDAVDIGAGGVVLVPQPGSLDLPDLMPYKAPVQLGVELMVMHLRSLADLAYVFEINLYLLPVNRYDAAFMNLLDEGVELRRRIKFHKHILLAADTYHMAHTESDPVAALRKARNSVGYLYLAENNGGLPGSGRVDFGALRGALGERTTWAVVTRHDTPQPPGQHALQDAVAYLHGAGY